MRIAFYAPMKPPDDPAPSGDRAMALALMAALAAGGHDVRLASRFRSRSSDPSTEALTRLAAEGEREAARLLDGYSEPEAWRPELWFTYHLYYKAPDWLGPAVARAIAIPYVTAEASYAAKRDRDAWAPWQAIAVEALRFARLNICLTTQDRDGVEQLEGRSGRLADLPPFIDCASTDAVQAGRTGSHPPHLVTVAMMRADVKRDSYLFLASALARLTDLDWRLTIVGDGPARGEIEAAFAALPAGRVQFAGEVDAAGVRAYLAAGDLYLWPGFGEAFGVAYLEAQAMGLPVVAMRTGGIASVVEDEVTGLLTAAGDVESYAAAVRRLLTDDALRRRMASAARRFVHDERSIQPTACRLSALLAAVM